MGAGRAGRIAQLFVVVGLLLNPACHGSEGELFFFEEGSAGGAGGVDSENQETGGQTAAPGEVTWPRLGAQSSLQIQLSGGVDLDVEADFYVIDLHSPEDSQLATLRERGAYVACYFSSGSYEPFRPDADEFPERVLGDALADYPDERWLDITDAVVLDLMVARMERAQARGCDAVYPSTVRTNDPGAGFQLDAVDYAAYSASLAKAAHASGLGAIYAGSEYASSEALDYDAALVFGCAKANSCDSWTSLEDNGISIFLVELANRAEAEETCGLFPESPWPFIVKEPNLAEYRQICP